MRRIILAAGIAAMLTPAMPALAKKHHHDREYWADRHYRDDNRYQERSLGRGDRVYRGSNGRYYCKRKDGTTGLIVGGLAGGVLGNTIAPGGSKTLGTILGGVGGALAGKSLDDGVKCR